MIMIHMINISMHFVLIFYFLFLFIIKGGNGGVAYQGQVLNVEQDISVITTQLPLMPAEIPCFIVRKSNQNSISGYRDFKIHKQNIYLWLQFLKANNRFYCDIDLGVAQDRLNNIETDDQGSIHNSMRSMEEEDLESELASAGLSGDRNQDEVDPLDPSLATNRTAADANANSNASDEFVNTNEQSIGPSTGGASGEALAADVVHEFASLPPGTRETEQQRNIRILQNLAPEARPPPTDPTHWPPLGAFVNDFDEVGLHSKAFPTLYPYGAGDPSCRDRNTEVSMDDAGKHLMKYAVNLKKAKEALLPKCETDAQRAAVNALYPDENSILFLYPFVVNDRFVHFQQNTVERHRAFNQRSFWLSRHTEYSTMNDNEIGIVINSGGERLQQLLGSMQSFNANINGSPQYLYKKRQMLENLIEQRGMCTMWYTLSMADNHWDDLFHLLHRDEVGKKQTFPVFATPRAEASWKRKFVRTNPHIVDAYFNERVHTLFDKVFSKSGIELEWNWYRIEYQGRGAPHVHGCLRLKRDPGIAKLSKTILHGRLASIQLQKNNQTGPSVFIPAYHIQSDTHKAGDTVVELDLSISGLKKAVDDGIAAHDIVVSFHDFLLTTMNDAPPCDASLNVRDESTYFDPRVSNDRHPSACNPLDVHDNEAASSELYCKSCNVQSRHKHQAYCDKSHRTRELARIAFRTDPTLPNPDTIPVDCRFSYAKKIMEKTHVAIEVSGEEIYRIKLVSKRNDMWMGSHIRAIMEVRKLV